MKRILSALLVLAIILSLSACTTSISSNSDYIPPSDDVIEDVNYGNVSESPKETIGNILSTKKTYCTAFGDGYAICTTRNISTSEGIAYIINTSGEICGTFKYDSINESVETTRFNNGVALFRPWISAQDNSYLLINTSGETVLAPNDEFSHILGITESNIILVSKLTQTIDGSSVQFGAIDTNGKWLLPLKEIGIEISSVNQCINAEYISDNVFCIRRRTYHKYDYDEFSSPYYFNVKTGEVSMEYNTPSLTIDYRGEKNVDRGKIQEDCVALIEGNNSGAIFVAVVDKNGKELFEPIQVYRGEVWAYSEGLLAIQINRGEITYIDRTGKICANIPAMHDAWSPGVDYELIECHDGIVTNGRHYYDKNGNLLFE